MADLALGLAKSAVEGTLTQAKSAIEEEKKLRKSVQLDLMVISDEFEMMHSFLNFASEERVTNDMRRTWVRQVRNLALDLEDCIDSVVHLDNKSNWWRRLLPPCLPAAAPVVALDEAVSDIEQLKARVEAMGQRNMRYSLIEDSGSKPVVQQQPAADASSFDILVEARDAAKKQCGLKDLTELITDIDGDLQLQVISVWGTRGDLGTTSIIRKAYDDPEIRQTFGCRAWVKLMHPFNPHEFIRSLLAQFYANSHQEQHGAILGVDVLKRMKATEDDLLEEFMQQVNKQTYLLVLEDVSTMVEWDAIRMYLPNRRNRSRIVVSTQQFEIASLCTGEPCRVSELKQYSTDHSVCVLFKQGSRHDGDTGEETDWPMANCKEILTEDGVSSSDKNLASERKVAPRADKFHLVGCEIRTAELYMKLANARWNRKSTFGVISVWGIAGVGKSTLVRTVYEKEMLNDIFKRYAWINVSHPFSLRKFTRSLLLALQTNKEKADFGMLAIKDPIQECWKLLHEHNCLVVIDGLQSTEQWDLIKARLVAGPPGSVIIVITNDTSVAKHSAVPGDAVYNVKSLEAEAALDLFKKEVFGKTETSDLDPNDEKIELAELIVKKCGGIPKVISAISHFLSTRRNMMWDWRSLNDDFMHELEINPKFDSLQGLFAWMHFYFRTCPDSLKPCIFYMSIFPGDHSIRRRRLLRRWMAEGYSRDTDSNTAEENGEMFFCKLVDLSIIQQPAQTVASTGLRMVVCQVNSFFREYILSRPMEENLVFALEGRCSLNTQLTGRHLTIGSSWDRDRNVFEGIDFSRLRSLTVFGEWSGFFISDKMRLLRVLDLEDTSGVTGDDLEQMVKRLSRLKFLSLRGCTTIHHLPDSLGGLKQLQTLDVRNTCIVTLPKTITKLQKLQYLRAGKSLVPLGDDAGTVTSLSAAENQLSTPTRSRPHPLASWLSEFCRRRLAGADHADGVEVPRGIGKLTALHTMGVVNVNVAEGEAILKELKNLTQLHKLGVSGVNRRNSQALCSAISGHGHLESLSVRLEKDNSEGCLDGISRPPETLQSLKLYGNVDKLPVWIKQLRKLRKLNLEITTLRQEDMYVLGVLPLRILRLFVKPIHDSRLHFCPEPKKGPFIFNMVKVLEIACNSRLNVLFAEGAMGNVELLKVLCYSGSSLRFSGLVHLGLKQVLLKGSYDDALKEDLQRQLAKHPKDIKPDLKLDVEICNAYLDSSRNIECVQEREISQRSSLPSHA